MVPPLSFFGLFQNRLRKLIPKTLLNQFFEPLDAQRQGSVLFPNRIVLLGLFFQALDLLLLLLSLPVHRLDVLIVFSQAERRVEILRHGAHMPNGWVLRLVVPSALPANSRAAATDQ